MPETGRSPIYKGEMSDKELEAMGTEKTNRRKQYESPVDSGYSWVVLLAAFMLNLFMAGQFGTLGLFLVEYLHYFGGKKSPITWIGAAQMFVGYFLGPVNGALMKRFGCRPIAMVSALMVSGGYVVSAFFPYLPILYVFYGVISGIGFLNFYLVAMVSVQQYFSKRRAMAAGVIMSGLSLGIFLGPPLTRYLIDKYSWRGALLIEAGIFLNGLVFGLLIRPISRPEKKKKEKSRPGMKNVVQNGKILSPTDLKTKSLAIPVKKNVDGENSIVLLSNEHLNHNGNGYVHCEEDDDSVKEQKKKDGLCSKLPLKKYGTFYMFLAGYFCIQLGHMTIYTYTPVKGDALGINKADVSFLVSLMGITGIFARPVIGIVGDSKCANRTVLIGLSAIVVGICTLISTVFKGYIPLAVFSGTFGFFSSGYMALYGAALVDIVGVGNIEVTGGALMLSKGTANLLLHAVNGWVMDMTGNPNAPFIIFGIAQAIGGLIIVPIPWVLDWQRRPKDADVEMEVEVDSADSEL